MGDYDETYDEFNEVTQNYDWSNKYSFTSSEFIVGNSSINYKLVDAPIAKLKNDFKFFEEIPGIENLPVRVLIQRELDKKRASDDIYNGYLKSNKIKFFSPLIVALVPYKEQKIKNNFEGKINHINLSEFENVFSSNTVRQSEYKDDKDFIISIKKNGNAKNGFFAWDKYNIHAVVIDGQHRLQSLIEYQNNKDVNYEKMSVPIVILDFRDHVEDVISIVRSIFIALNHTPKPIDPGRLILLNDHSIPAILTQEILNENEYSLEREFIDLKCENGKHDAQYLTGVTTLYFIISDIFLKKRSIDLFDISLTVNKLKIKPFINNLNAFLMLDDDITNGNFSQYGLSEIDTLNSMYTRTFDFENEDEDDDFSDDTKFFKIKPEHFNAIRDSFIKKRLVIFSRIFKELFIFSEYWKKVEKIGLNDKNSIICKYLRKTESGKKIFNEELDTSEKSEIKSKLEILKSIKNDVVFSTVGQKSIFNFYFINYYTLNPEDINFTLDKYIESLNELYLFLQEKLLSDKVFNKDFQKNGIYIWRGIATNTDGTLDNTSNSVKRITNFIILLSYIKNNEICFDDFGEDTNKAKLETLKTKIINSSQVFNSFEYTSFKSSFIKNYNDYPKEEKESQAYKDVLNHIIEVAKLLK